MSNPYTIAFDAVATRFADLATATITRGTDSISGCLCSGLDRMREADEYGRQITITGNITYKYTSEPTTPLAEGDVITVAMDSHTGTETVRIVGKRVVAGIVNIIVTGEHE
jgi:hypothetical protein